MVNATKLHGKGWFGFKAEEVKVGTKEAEGSQREGRAAAAEQVHLGHTLNVADYVILWTIKSELSYYRSRNQYILDLVVPQKELLILSQSEARVSFQTFKDTECMGRSASVTRVLLIELLLHRTWLLPTSWQMNSK